VVETSLYCLFRNHAKLQEIAPRYPSKKLRALQSGEFLIHAAVEIRNLEPGKSLTPMAV
jgi:hypothetical protein